MGSVTIAKSYEERENLLGGMHILCLLQRGEHREMNVLKAKETTNAEVPYPPRTRSFITVSLGIKCANEFFGDRVKCTLNSIGLGWS